MQTNQNTTVIHPTAIVEKGAELGVGVEIGPYAIVGSKVKLGDRVKVSAHGVVRGSTVIGAETKIWSFASIGTEPQDLKYRGEDATLTIGERNMFREYSNVSIGTEGGGWKTVVGSDNLFMVGVHIGHDCIIGSHCIFANNVSLGGHVEVGDRAVLGGHSAVHQFVKIGKLAMLAGGSIVVQDVPSFVTVFGGDHAKPTGLNLIGLKRSGRSREAIAAIKDMYSILYTSNLTFDEAKEKIAKEYPTEDGEIFLNLLLSSTRGVCR